MKSNDNQINKRIASFRLLAGYTQERAAEALGMNKNTYARMERSGSPKLEVLKKMAELYNVTAESILYGVQIIKSDDKANKNDSFNDSGIKQENEPQLMLTINEKNCIKLCRKLSNKERTELFEKIQKYVNEKLK